MNPLYVKISWTCSLTFVADHYITPYKISFQLKFFKIPRASITDALKFNAKPFIHVCCGAFWLSSYEHVPAKLGALLKVDSINDNIILNSSSQHRHLEFGHSAPWYRHLGLCTLCVYHGLKRMDCVLIFYAVRMISDNTTTWVIFIDLVWPAWGVEWDHEHYLAFYKLVLLVQYRTKHTWCFRMCLLKIIALMFSFVMRASEQAAFCFEQRKINTVINMMWKLLQAYTHTIGPPGQISAISTTLVEHQGMTILLLRSLFVYYLEPSLWSSCSNHSSQ